MDWHHNHSQLDCAGASVLPLCHPLATMIARTWRGAAAATDGDAYEVHTQVVPEA
jgi:hypothetical protein